MGRKRPQAERPYRDWYDYVTLVLGALGFAAVVYTIVITLTSNEENGRDTANAISAMNNISVEMQRDRPLLAKQAQAASDASIAAAKSATSAKVQAIASRNQADAAIGQASAAVNLAASSEKQILQSAKQFTTQQRPVLVFVFNAENGSPQSDGKLVTWRYTYENVGASPAFDLEIYQAFKIGEDGFQKQILDGPKILAVRDPKISIAKADSDISAGPLVLRQGFALFIVFKYKDAGGNMFLDTFCGETLKGTTVEVCDKKYAKRLAADPSWPIPKTFN